LEEMDEQFQEHLDSILEKNNWLKEEISMNV
jgi:hypothetical protein